MSRAMDEELADVITTNLYYDRDMMFQKNIEDQVEKLTVEDVNRVIAKYFKTYENWTVVNGGDFYKSEIKQEGAKID